MNIHEYQTKNLLTRYGFPVPPYASADSIDEATQIIKELGLQEGVIKVQVHAGGRGKAGGVKIGHDPDELVKLAGQLIGMKIVNEQTGSHGIVAKKILITPLIKIQKEYYLAATIDRSEARPIILASKEGGVDIEQTVRTHPDKILKIPIQLNGKMRHYHLLEIARFMGWDGKIKDEGLRLTAILATIFMETDSALLEINPLVLTSENELTALDARFSVDDNALYRQPAIMQWYDPSQYTPNEVMAKEQNLAYIGLDGNIGCLVNGAGLAMATMDIIRYYGGSPANFLDVGGGATKEEVAHGFKIILSDPSIQSIFVNIFGGIMDCALLAEGIVTASKEEQLKVPLVIRMEGTNVEKGKRILQDSKLNITIADTLAKGAEYAVKAAEGA